MRTIQQFARLGMILGTLALTALPTFGQIYGVIDGKDVKVLSAHAEEGQYAVEIEGVMSYAPADAVQIYKVKGEVATNGAALRKLPHPESGVLTTLGKGDAVSVMGQKGSWYEVVLADGTQGYMYNTQVEGECLQLLPEVEVEMQAPIEVVQWSTASQVIPRGSVVTIEDVYTGKKFQIKRTFGTNHADVEALTKTDTQIIKQIWGGFNWDRRPVIVHVKGRRLAASMAGMPHAGDSLDAVKGNGMNGVMDLHFKGSRKHKDGNISATVDPLHQKAIQIAAQYKG
ncbi:MAG: SH3 domain-containing protein [Cellulosilyticaceae bacterium]